MTPDYQLKPALIMPAQRCSSPILLSLKAHQLSKITINFQKCLLKWQVFVGEFFKNMFQALKNV